jgi:hypothetical protein
MIRITILAALLAFTHLAGCTSEGNPGVSSSGRTTSWRLEVSAQGSVTFGARMFLDGEQVYLDSSSMRESHRIDLERPHSAGEHVLEVEIVSASQTVAANYVASCTAQILPGGRSVHADGIPWTLAVGQRLRLSVLL